jgi:LmbE family N-acetylglucosaminyl deacetylase
MKENKKSRRILAIFAHPDDETFLAGGTLAKYAAAGWDVFLLCATRGEAGKRGEYGRLTREQFALLRKEELEAACRALGIHRPVFLECADKGLARDCWNSATEEIVNAIRRIRPDVVVTFGPDGISGHPDHVALSQIVTAGFWGAGMSTYLTGKQGKAAPFRPSHLYYVLRSLSVLECCKPSSPQKARTLTTVVDIRGFGERKLEAMRAHRSQKHMQFSDPALIEKMLTAPENFHRAFPIWHGPGLEADLFGDVDSESSNQVHRKHNIDPVAEPQQMNNGVTGWPSSSSQRPTPALVISQPTAPEEGTPHK